MPFILSSFRIDVDVAQLHFAALPVVPAGLPDEHLCIFAEHRIEELVFTAFSLLFGKRSSPTLELHIYLTLSVSVLDVGALVVIVIRLVWRRPPSVRMSSLVQTIVKDATLYVLLLCTSRLVFVSLLVSAKVRTTLIPRNNMRY